MTPAKTDDQWVAEIRAQHARTVDGILELGRMLIAAKADLGHGKFQIMISRRLPFDKSTAQKLMKIAKDRRIANAAQARLLPSSWTTIIELAKLDDGTFGDAAASGAINPKMTRQDVKRIKAEVTNAGPAFTAPGTKAVTQGPTINIRPRTADAENEEPVTIEHEEPVADVAPSGLKNLAKAADAYVAAIASAIEQGDRPDLIAGFDEALRRRVCELLANLPARTH